MLFRIESILQKLYQYAAAFIVGVQLFINIISKINIVFI